MSGNKNGYSTTSQKHRNFVSEPMGNRSVRDVPGIGPVQGRRLEEKGINRQVHYIGIRCHYQVGTLHKNTVPLPGRCTA
ncbi:Barrier-to-autointegration factor B [Salmo salar]|uniref:Barrier-to-autointegration factor B n=1 Tax=Salmo salar TaxID=8030 RepID=B5XCN5_SALSA|nr:Barrier-to-autointegration factor B [Salmo salar]ACI68605.1 Barrier-to-autointegration factor B [Salmo salar]|eukprot:NP_001135352.1 Barrier-to-autointegration factor B [Salmo salar]